MERKILADVLKRVEPALASKDLIPVFACFCFDGETVTAYDDVVALQYPLEVGITGAVRGKLLSDFLGASRAKEVEVSVENGSLTIKAGRAKLETPLFGSDEFLFKRPKMKTATALAITDDFMAALGKAMVSMGRDPSHPWRLGVTLVTSSDSGLVFYSSDNKTATRVTCKVKGEEVADLVTLLPPRLCELATDIGRGDKPKTLTLSDKWVTVEFTSGLLLYSRTIDGAEVEGFTKLFKQLDKAGEGVEIPKGLDKCLERALVVLPHAKEPHTSLRVKGDKLMLATISDAGNVKDSITIDSHDEAKVTCEPNLLHRALPHADTLALLPDKGCVLLKGKGLTHLISIVEEGQQPDADKED